MSKSQIIHGDCVEEMRGMDECSIDAIICDPPYDLTAGKKGGTGVKSVNLDSPYGRARIGTGNGSGGFMGMGWDATGVAFDPETWRAALRVLKPGGHLLAFGGTRTFHRLAVAIEDAGFEIRDTLTWLYGSGFPKSLDVGKAIDKMAGAERDVVGQRVRLGDARPYTADMTKTYHGNYSESGEIANITAPATDAAKQWDGWGTALKPAWEPIILARKPLGGVHHIRLTPEVLATWEDRRCGHE